MRTVFVPRKAQAHVNWCLRLFIARFCKRRDIGPITERVEPIGPSSTASWWPTGQKHINHKSTKQKFKTKAIYSAHLLGLQLPISSAGTYAMSNEELQLKYKMEDLKVFRWGCHRYSKVYSHSVMHSSSKDYLAAAPNSSLWQIIWSNSSSRRAGLMKFSEYAYDT